MSPASDDTDEFDPPCPIDDALSTGAAADAADADGPLQRLPRVLRYAMLIKNNAAHIHERLLAELNEICPGLPEAAAWGCLLDPDSGRALASELDRRAAVDDEPNLRSIADCVRLLCLPLPREAAYLDDHRRVGKITSFCLPERGPQHGRAALLRPRDVRLWLGCAARLLG